MQCQMTTSTKDPYGFIDIKRCQREARYINSAGEQLCSLCDMHRESVASIKLGDIPTLLVALKALLDGADAPKIYEDNIKELLWRKNPT